MTKAELIRILADKSSHLPFMVIDQAVKDVFSLMSSALQTGDRIEIRGFGSFSPRFRKPRLARNPKTGDTLTTDGKHTIHFKPGKELKERVCVSRGVYPIKEA